MTLPKLTLAAILCLIAASAHAQTHDCLSNLPDTFKSAVEQDNWKIVQPFDIPTDDWKLWKNAHQGECPGVAVGNFFPKTNSSYIVSLIQGDDAKGFLQKVVLVTAKKGQTITEIVVNPIQSKTPSVVWKLPPGHYAGVDGTTAGISRDSFVVEKVSASATQFYYQGSNLKSFSISF